MSLEKLQPTLDEVQKLIVLDGAETDSQDLISLVTKSLSSDVYIKSIKVTIDQILKDKKIDAADVPMLILLSLQVTQSLPKLLGLTKAVPLSQVKYIIYGSIIYYIYQNVPDYFSQDGMSLDLFRVMFMSLWPLVEVNPANAVLAVEQMCAGCCTAATPVKPAEPVA